MEFKTELHCHTKEISPCAAESAAESVKKYIDCGYTTLAITNHAYNMGFDMIPRETWNEKVDYFFDAMDLAREAAGDRLHIIYGMEAAFPSEGYQYDYLVYGVTREMLYPCQELFFEQDGRALREFTLKNDLLLIQAHPMRDSEAALHPSLVDGYEVFNGHNELNSYNERTEAWVEKYRDEYNMILTSGSDSHNRFNPPNSGIITPEPIKTAKELLSVLRSGGYGIIKSEIEYIEIPEE